MGETFIVLHESDNNHDRHTVAVYCEDSGVIVEHLPHKILKTCDYSTKHEETSVEK